MANIHSSSGSLSFLQSLESRMMLSAGDLNLNFAGGGGRLLFPAPIGGEVAMSVATQPDGKVVLAGGSTHWASAWLQRLDASGKPDASFGSDGVVKQPISNFVSTCDIARQPDGKFVIAGCTKTGGFLARFTSSGKLDTTFDGDGVKSSGLGLYKLAILPNGNLAALSTKNRVVEFNSNGSTNMSFGSSGGASYLTGISAVTGFAYVDIDAQKDNKLVITGTAAVQVDSGTHLEGAVGVVRLASSGKRDKSFSTDGFAYDAFTGHDQARGAAIQSTGRIVTVGVDDNSNTYVVGFNSDGSKKFEKMSNWSSSFAEGPHGVALDSSDRIIVIGHSDPTDGAEGAASSLDFAVQRLSSDGKTQDFSKFVDFSTPDHGRDDWPYAASVAGDGNIIIVGRSEFAGSGEDEQVAVASIQGKSGGPSDDIPITQSDGRYTITGTSNSDTIRVYRDAGFVEFNGNLQRFDFANSGIVINASSGNDSVKIIDSEGAGPVTLEGGSGNDSLVGGWGKDVLDGGSGNDSLAGGESVDALHGKDGNDKLDGGAGDDYLDGGAGSDSVDYSSRTETITAQITVDNSGSYFTTGAGGEVEENDKYFEVETLLGGAGGDHLAFHAGNYAAGATRGFMLVGNAGDDDIAVGDSPMVDRRSLVTIHGGDGDDHILATATTVQVWGEAGNDYLDLYDTDSTATVSADTGSGFDTCTYFVDPDGGMPKFTLPIACERFQGTGSMIISGNDLDNVFDIGYQAGATTQVFAMGGNDLIVFARAGDAASLIADGGSGDDTIFSGDGNDRLNGGSGNDRIDGFNGNDSIFGDDGNDLLLGEMDNDEIHGGAGDDSLWGGTGNDSLFGDSGRDKLNGEAGDDSLFARDGRTDSLDGGSGIDSAQRDNSSTIKDAVLNIESFI